MYLQMPVRFDGVWLLNLYDDSEEYVAYQGDTAGNWDAIDKDEVPNATEIFTAELAYASYVAKTGYDPLRYFPVPSTYEDVWQFEFMQTPYLNEKRPRWVGARRKWFDHWHLPKDCPWEVQLVADCTQDHERENLWVMEIEGMDALQKIADTVVKYGVGTVIQQSNTYLRVEHPVKMNRKLSAIKRDIKYEAQHWLRNNL